MSFVVCLGIARNVLHYEACDSYVISLSLYTCMPVYAWAIWSCIHVCKYLWMWPYTWNIVSKMQYQLSCPAEWCVCFFNHFSPSKRQSVRLIDGAKKLHSISSNSNITSIEHECISTHMKISKLKLVVVMLYYGSQFCDGVWALRRKSWSANIQAVCLEL